jgi:hypothetical protein
MTTPTSNVSCVPHTRLGATTIARPQPEGAISLTASDLRGFRRCGQFSPKLTRKEGRDVVGEVDALPERLELFGARVTSLWP